MKNSIYHLLIILLAAGTISYFVSCSPVDFSKNQSSGPGVGPTVCDANGVCTQHHHDSLNSGNYQADLLFVIDNEGSMSDIQKSLANRFSSLTSKLSGIDYQIGIVATSLTSVTSDTSSSYGTSAFGITFPEDGSLIPFPGGQQFMAASDTNAQNDFIQTMVRQETVNCERPPDGEAPFSIGVCPSQEPRGIFATILALQKNPSGFFRANVPLALVIVSDHDERDGNSDPNPSRTNEDNTNEIRNAYPLDLNDQPATLVSTMTQLFPTKSLVAHAIVIRPGDTACYSQRANKSGYPATIFGFFGNVYAQLVNQTGGVLGSVCESDYAAQMGQIGTAIENQAQNQMQFACVPPGNKYTLQFLDQNNNPVTGLTATPNFTTLQLIFNTPLPAKTQAVLDYDCEV